MIVFKNNESNKAIWYKRKFGLAFIFNGKSSKLGFYSSTSASFIIKIGRVFFYYSKNEPWF